MEVDRCRRHLRRRGQFRTLAANSRTPWPRIRSGYFCALPDGVLFYRGLFAGNSADCYARTDEGSSLSWSACENHKTARLEKGQTLFVAQASPDFSVENLEADPSQWATVLQQILDQKWELPTNDRLATFTHRWRFARYLGQALVENLPE